MLYTLKINGEVHLLHGGWDGIIRLLQEWGPGDYSVEIIPYTGPKHWEN